ncbi:MAG: hypothetical protein WCG47_34150 [Dermatophilaceae bacterium]
MARSCASAASAAGIPAADDVVLPPQVTSAASVGIIHLGIGAFHRAHQAIYTQEAMATAGESH